VLPGSALASVWPASASDNDTTKAIRASIDLGPQRTLPGDVEFGLIQLADIAVRALSPGVNDPTTALNCIDRLAEVLVALGARHPAPWSQTDDTGRVRVVVPRLTFARATAVSFEQIRHYGVRDPVVATHLLDTLGTMSPLLPARNQEVIDQHIEATVHAARAALMDRVELEHIEVAAESARMRRA
jgi:uncharacterized membrane protein